jgi:hypothetical protein
MVQKKYISQPDNCRILLNFLYDDDRAKGVLFGIKNTNKKINLI